MAIYTRRVLPQLGGLSRASDAACSSTLAPRRLLAANNLGEKLECKPAYPAGSKITVYSTTSDLEQDVSVTIEQLAVDSGVGVALTNILVPIIS